MIARFALLSEAMSAEMRGRVLVVVLGATGTGKSKLGIQLARAFQGEVISADSMQVYRGLPVATNKVTPEECQGVPHHCLDFLEPLQNYTVVDFRDRALPIMEGLMKEGKLPVVVGGTHYYIESLLWDVLVGDGETIAETLETGPVTAKGKLRLLLEEMEYLQAVGKLSSEEVKKLEGALGLETSTLELEGMTEDELVQMVERGREAERTVEERHPDPARLRNRSLHARLREVDPDRAQQLHYNDVRKIRRSLEIFSRGGVRHSELLRRQREAAGGSELGGPLRFPPHLTAVLWVSVHQEVLDRRLDSRVDQMLTQGLLQELEAFHASYAKNNPSQDYTHGIFQTIGLKEFHSYLSLEEKESEEAQARLQECVEALKIATRRYARRQIKWIQGRFLKAYGRQVPSVYMLDGTDLEEWDKKVLAPARAVVEHFLGLPVEEGQLPEPLPQIHPPLNQNKEERLCKTCMRVFIGDLQWETHLKSKKHQAFVKKKQKQGERIS